MKKINEQYVPKIGDCVKLVELHKSDAYYSKKYLDMTLIIDEIGQWDSIIHSELFPFAWARTHEQDSGKLIIFHAAKFAPVEDK